jgi:IS5 family transposase
MELSGTALMRSRCVIAFQADDMMQRQTPTGFERYGKTTRRAQFFADMQLIAPWAELAALVEPFYPMIREAGEQPALPLPRMLRVYFLQLWFNLSDGAVAEALHDSASMRHFIGIDPGADASPDEMTVCRFRELLESNRLGKKLLATLNDYLRRHGIKIANGAIVDATIIAAMTATRKGDRRRDPKGT